MCVVIPAVVLLGLTLLMTKGMMLVVGFGSDGCFDGR